MIKFPVLNLTDISFILVCVVLYNGLLSLFDYVIYGIFFFVFLLSIYNKDSKKIYTLIYNKYHLFLMAFILYFFVLSLGVYSIESSLFRSYQQYVIYSPFIFYLYYVCYEKKDKCAFLAKICILIMGVMLLSALIHYGNDIYLIRKTVSGRAELPHGIGGDPYSFCYALNIVSLFFVHQIINSARNRWSVIKILFILFTTILTILSDSATTIFIYSFCVFLCVSYSLFNKVSFFDNSHIKVILIICMLFISYFAIINVDVSIIREYNIGGPFLQDRFYKVQCFLQGVSVSDIGESFAEREELRNTSINTFLENPIIGVWGTQYKLASDIVGGHSGLFDWFAQYGLLGMFPLMMYLICIYRLMYYQQHFYLALYPFFVSLMNPLSGPTVFFSMLCVVPLLISVSVEKEM